MRAAGIGYARAMSGRHQLAGGVVTPPTPQSGPGFAGRRCIATPFGRNAALLGEDEGIDVLEVPVSASYADLLPRIEDVERANVAVVGIPFDSSVSFRPGARLGLSHVREISRLLHPYNPAQVVYPFATQQGVDAGDMAVSCRVGIRGTAPCTCLSTSTCSTRPTHRARARPRRAA